MFRARLSIISPSEGPDNCFPARPAALWPGWRTSDTWCGPALAKIGASAARRYFLTGERFDAATALRIGLVHEVAADVDAAVDAVVTELLSGGPGAVRTAKRLVRERPDGEEAAHVAAKLRAGDEGQEGLRAFLERRTPSWRG